MIYKSKIDFYLLLFPTLVIFGEAWLFISIPVWIGVVILLVISIPLVSVIFNTYYQITQQNLLVIKCGFLSTYEIEISKIYSVLSRKGLAGLESSPALSFDRIAIHYYEGYGSKTVLISPKNKIEFTKRLKEINPKITIAI